jgi:hypothetical protein
MVMRVLLLGAEMGLEWNGLSWVKTEARPNTGGESAEYHIFASKP